MAVTGACASMPNAVLPPTSLSLPPSLGKELVTLCSPSLPSGFLSFRLADLTTRLSLRHTQSSRRDKRAFLQATLWASPYLSVNQ